jgi:hypothetical protein
VIETTAAHGMYDRSRSRRKASLANLAQGTLGKMLDQEEVKPRKVGYYLEKRGPEFCAARSPRCQASTLSPAMARDTCSLTNARCHPPRAGCASPKSE